MRRTNLKTGDTQLLEHKPLEVPLNIPEGFVIATTRADWTGMLLKGKVISEHRILDSHGRYKAGFILLVSKCHEAFHVEALKNSGLL